MSGGILGIGRTVFLHRVGDQEFPTSETGTPGAGTEYRDDPTGSDSGEGRGGEVGPAEGSTVAKSARKGPAFSDVATNEVAKKNSTLSEPS